MEILDGDTSPGPLDISPAPLTTSRTCNDHGNVLSPHDNVTDAAVVAAPKSEHQHSNKRNTNKLRIVHLSEAPLQTDYETLKKSFEKYGNICEIRMRMNDDTERWDVWIMYSRYEEAFAAVCDILNININEESINGALCDKVPYNLDVYHPADWDDGKNLQSENSCLRKPKPPMWITATAEGDNFNYFRICKFLQKKVGSIKSGDISRFGKKSVLINAK